MNSALITLDTRGEKCPVPLLKLAKTFRDQPLIVQIEIWSDDPASVADIPAWCRMTDHELKSHEKSNDYWKFVVLRKA